ncbi:hypothetical protein FGB62_139g217 [Gracilaria domingensis]|nr:hypothetical protein FGB62_139g217 [Gracilaria domingensis]
MKSVSLFLLMLAAVLCATIGAAVPKKNDVMRAYKKAQLHAISDMENGASVRDWDDDDWGDDWDDDDHYPGYWNPYPIYYYPRQYHYKPKRSAPKRKRFGGKGDDSSDDDRR